MPEHQFCYPRVVPVTANDRPADGTARNARASRNRRELVAESPVRRPPPAGGPPRSVKR